MIVITSSVKTDILLGEEKGEGGWMNQQEPKCWEYTKEMNGHDLNGHFLKYSK